MKKLLISVIIVLLIVLTGITVITGLHLGGITILGIGEIKKENDELNTTINEAMQLTSTEYQNKIDELNKKIKKLETEKTTYQQMVSVSTENQLNTANQIIGGYKIEYLWVQIGTHAKTEGVVMKMDVAKGSTGTENIYNLNFTVTGTYVGISEFITDIEDDSKLGFKIESFKLLASSGGTDTLQATFVCKDIKITGISSSAITTTTTENNTIDNTTGNTTTNNTITNSTTTNSTTNGNTNKNNNVTQ